MQNQSKSNILRLHLSPPLSPQYNNIVSPHMFENIFNLLPETICIINSSDEIVQANKAFGDKIITISKNSSIHFIEDLIHREDIKSFRESLELVINGCSNVTVRKCRTLTSGGSHDFPIFRRFDWILNLFSEQKLILASGRQLSNLDDHDDDSLSEFIDFFQKAPIALHWLSSTGHILWANETELRTLGYQAEEYIGQPVMKFCPDEEDLVLEIFKQLGTGNTIKDVPVRFRCKNGDIRNLLIDSNVNWNPDGTFRHTRCFIRDDTARKIKEAVNEYEKNHFIHTAIAKDAFIRRIFHGKWSFPPHFILLLYAEIRTPLHVIQAYLDAINGHDDIITKIQHQLDHMNGMIGDLAFAKMFEDGNTITLNPEPILLRDNISYIFQDLVTELRQNDAISIDLDMSAVPNQVVADKSLLRVLYHLLRNAIIYSPKCTTVDIKVTCQYTEKFHRGRKYKNYTTNSHGRFSFYITNAVHQAMNLSTVHGCFQNYYASKSLVKSVVNNHKGVEEVGGGEMVGNDTTSSSSSDILLSQSGLGLGLNVAYNMVQSMGGLLECSGDDEKSCFWFSVNLDSFPDVSPPLAMQASFSSLKSDMPENHHWTAVEESEEANQHVRNDCCLPLPTRPKLLHKKPRDSMTSSDNEYEDVTTLDGGEEEKEDRKYSCGNNNRQRRILIVDDSTMCQKVMVKYVQGLGYLTDVASNGQEAIDKLRQYPTLFDAVLMDLRMPIMDGVTATKKCRMELKLSLPIIAVSAELHDNLDQLLEAGFNTFVAKPASIQEIKNALTTHCA